MPFRTTIKWEPERGWERERAKSEGRKSGAGSGSGKQPPLKSQIHVGEERPTVLHDRILPELVAHRHAVAPIERVVDTDRVTQSPTRLLAGEDQVPHHGRIGFALW